MEPSVDPSFERLPEEKKLRIIEGALKEFAEYGFSEASTNRIVKAVGISKGSLFKYFKSKDDLYLYVAEYLLLKINPILIARMKDLPPDILDRLILSAEAVLSIYIENPYYYRFFMGIIESSARHIQLKLLQRNEELFKMMDIFSGVDTASFRSSVEDTFLLIKWLFSGIKQEIFEIQEALDDPSEMRNEFIKRLNRVIIPLKEGIYR